MFGKRNRPTTEGRFRLVEDQDFQGEQFNYFTLTPLLVVCGINVCKRFMKDDHASLAIA